MIGKELSKDEVGLSVCGKIVDVRGVDNSNNVKA